MARRCRSDQAGEVLGNEENPEIAELRAKIVEVEGMLEELREKQQDAALHLQQAVKRHQTDLDNENKYGFTKFALELLHVPDNLERALDSVKTEELDENQELRELHAGVGRMRKAVKDALKEFGVVKMKALDQHFNPEHHEAMFAMDMPGKEPNTIFHVMEPGYMIHDRTLRAAKVGIVRS